MGASGAGLERTGASRRAAARAAAAVLVALACAGCPGGAEPAGGAKPPQQKPAQRPVGAGGAARPSDSPPPAPANGGGASPAGAPAETDSGRNIPQLAADLDHRDQRIAFHAAIELLDARDDSRAIEAIRARLTLGRGPSGNGETPKDPQRTIEQQRTIVDAIGRYPLSGSRRAAAGPALVKALIPLVAPFLGHPDQDLRKAAVEAFAALDALDAADEDDEVARYIASRLDAPKDLGPSVIERISAVRVTGRKPPKTSVRLLIAAYERSPIADVREAARGELYRITGQSFRAADEAKNWFEKNQEKSQDQWYQERIDRIVADLNSARENDRANWELYRKTLADDVARHMPFLENSVKASPNPLIRIEAAKRLVETGRAEAFDLVVQAAREDKDAEVRRAALVDSISKAPPTDPAVRAKIIDGILPLTDAAEKEVRFGAVSALGKLKAERAVDPLLKRLANPQRDADVATAVLQALTEIAPRADGLVGKSLDDFLEREVARPTADPLRDIRLIEQAAQTLGVLQWPETSTEVRRASELLVRILEAKLPPADPKTADPKAAPEPRFEARTRLVAVISIAALKHPSATDALARALADRDDLVASEAARALGAIALRRGIAAADRATAQAALVGVFDGTRPAQKDAALDAVREATKADPTAELPLFRDIKDKLLPAKDFGRVVKLLKELPPRLPAEAPASARAVHVELRKALAESYDSLQPTPDPKAALEIWEQLAKDDPDAFAESFADQLAKLPSERADDLYADLLRRPGVDEAKRKLLWGKRVELARKFVGLALDGRSKEIDRAKARALLEKVLGVDPASGVMPADVKQELGQLRKSLGSDPAGGPEPRSGGTVPAGAKQPGRGGGAP
jgi:HEAT repeat protein